jgi:hypothetical protein
MGWTKNWNNSHVPVHGLKRDSILIAIEPNILAELLHGFEKLLEKCAFFESCFKHVLLGKRSGASRAKKFPAELM